MERRIYITNQTSNLQEMEDKINNAKIWVKILVKIQVKI